MLMAHPAILAASTSSEILAVISNYGPVNYTMHIRSSFVDKEADLVDEYFRP